MSGLSVEFVEIMREHQARLLRELPAACRLEPLGDNLHGRVFYCHTHDRRFLVPAGQAEPATCQEREAEPA